MTFTQLLAEIDATWREQPRHVRVLGAESRADLERLTKPMPFGRGELPPLLTTRQVEMIVSSR